MRVFHPLSKGHPLVMSRGTIATCATPSPASRRLPMSDTTRDAREATTGLDLDAARKHVSGIENAARNGNYSSANVLFHAYTLSEAAAFTVAHLGAGEFGSDDLAGNVRRFRREAQGKDAD